MFIFSAILLFVESGFLAYVVKFYKDHGICKLLEFFEFDSRCEQLTTGTVSFLFKYFSVKATFKAISDAILEKEQLESHVVKRSKLEYATSAYIEKKIN